MGRASWCRSVKLGKRENSEMWQSLTSNEGSSASDRRRSGGVNWNAGKWGAELNSRGGRGCRELGSRSYVAVCDVRDILADAPPVGVNVNPDLATLAVSTAWSASLSSVTYNPT